MKKIVAVLLLSVVLLSLNSCAGDTSEATIVPIKSDVYTTEDYEDAIQVVFDEFKDNFNGCTMKEIRYMYNEERDSIDGGEREYMDDYAKEYGVDEAIVLEVDFKTGSNPRTGLNDNDTYDFYNFILARNHGEKWTVMDAGY